MIAKSLEAADLAQIQKLLNAYSDAINAGKTEQIIAVRHPDMNHGSDTEIQKDV